MPKFTPGPWMKKRNSRFAGNDWTKIVCLNNPSLMIAKVFPLHPQGQRQPGDFEVEEKNVDLIAAAPSLYAAARNAYTLLKAQYEEDDAWDLPPFTLQQLASALTLADGEERIL